MHLRRDRAGDRARLGITRPKLMLRMALGKKLENGEAVAHDKALHLERRHLAGRRMAQDCCLAFRLAQANALFGEGNAAMRHGDPRPQAPG